MRIYSKIPGLIFLFLFPCHFAMAVIFSSVPFASINLQPGDSIQAGYTFGNFPSIYCFENSFQTDPAVAYLQWTFHGQLISQWTFQGQLISPVPLSSASIVINTSFQGGLADPSGRIVISNISGHPLVVSCQFAF